MSSPKCLPKGTTVKESRAMFQELAFFRHRLRKFLRFSEDAARACGITPQQHQLMLGIAGYTGTGTATISEIAEFLQEKHNSVVGLVDRAVQGGLVERTTDAADRRVVLVSLTDRGEDILRRLSLLHREEIKRLRKEFLHAGKRRSRTKRTARTHAAAKGSSH
ncbi:MAG: MarR family winged helix-turn-helix transcriptional regulator [Acidobacteriota bacterium]